MSLGMKAERKGLALSARWDDDYWKPAPNSEYAEGLDWPQVRGPHLTGAAIDCGKPLVDNLHNARLLWVAEEPIGGGKGGKPKVSFGFYPANFSGWGYAAYAAPVVADGRVYLYVLHPDRKQARTDPALQQNVLVRRGADPEIVADAHHAVFCFDGRTGRTLWRWISPSTTRRASSGKQGVGLTPCYLDGKLYVRVGGITCFDAKSGEVLWQKSDRAYATVGGWSHEESLVSVGGVLVALSRRADLVGVDPKTGEKLWEHENVTGSNQLAAKVTLDGKEYLVVARGNQDDENNPSDPSMFAIEPRTGKVLWTENSVGFNSASLLVDGKVVCGNISLPPAEKSKDAPRHTGGFQLSLDGAKELWTNEKTAYPGQRATPVAHDGYFYIDSRGSGFRALNAQTGKVVNQYPHIYAMTGGDHNWTWHIATDNRVITSGCLLFSTGEEGFKRLPGRLSLDLVGGYKCPVKPAIADGRLFVRTMNRLLCYDLRKPRATKDRRE
jgi:outer membrane protein assembly factor BamB